MIAFKRLSNAGFIRECSYGSDKRVALARIHYQWKALQPDL
ncbi:MAG: hypothetical protein AVDCRST_MAG95-1307 [uncultured Adhaeribacter sp.]|uniref:Uncharacterized protein n=1 Tax=uncultured Adhaeribacter sp. TaxID=448109 RepID=A0A6J4I0T0_9BACT|nr:MAG: hypothetical protein AVDCRST_MAG95-1307 [uncultured Adhaeribacter sp.]